MPAQANSPLILIVEDDFEQATLLSLHLQRQGYQTKHTSCALEALKHERSDLVVLDRCLPDMEGTLFCARFRRNSQAPILMLTGISGERARVEGLNAGADDYLEKPFSFEELTARIRALLRRSDPLRVSMQLRLIPERSAVIFKGKEILLTQTEFHLFSLLSAHPETVLTREDLTFLLWGISPTSSRCIDVNISRIRAKFAPLSAPIRSVRGGGYLFELQ